MAGGVRSWFARIEGGKQAITPAGYVQRYGTSIVINNFLAKLSL